ncbi:hypothetical protein DPMN_088736 [Dreissena polymorpha]|uniref:Uncharacterized protein n=1 Tax=Dreissena polymorpha TaxID=45954 RepID=A0A9D4QY57_DREPO|nr:hypothetical protein DPMN_088736 [Dreissena polymorpha]
MLKLEQTDQQTNVQTNRQGKNNMSPTKNDRQTDRQAKNNIPPIFRSGAIKSLRVPTPNKGAMYTGTERDAHLIQPSLVAGNMGLEHLPQRPGIDNRAGILEVF